MEPSILATKLIASVTKNIGKEVKHSGKQRMNEQSLEFIEELIVL